MKLYKSILVILGVSMLFGCSRKYISGKYLGERYQNQYEYSFFKNGNFTFSSTSYRLTQKTEGKYIKLDSIIFLHYFNDEFLVFWTNRLIYNQEGDYLRTYDGIYLCTTASELKQKNLTLDSLIAKYQFEIRKLSENKEYYPKDNNGDYIEFGVPSIGYMGVVMINNKEYHNFTMMEPFKGKDPVVFRVSDRNYMVDDERQIIYRSSGEIDSLVLIKEL